MPIVGRAAAIRSTQTDRRKPIRSFRKKQKVRELRGLCGNKLHKRLAQKCKDVRDSNPFQTTIIAVIIIAGVLVGLQTYDNLGSAVLAVVGVLDRVVLAVFIIEFLIKITAEGDRPQQFFDNGWNVFDFVIITVGLLPFGGQAVTVLRLVRLLRVLKLVRALPKLRILVMGLLKSLSSIAYIGLLLLLLFYLYAVLGVSFFGANDPVHFGVLHIALLTLFRCATLEDWTDVMYIAMEGCENYGYAGIEDQCTHSSRQGLVAAIFFVTFIVLSSMMILNLFIGVITSSMQDAKAALTEELERAKEEKEASENKKAPNQRTIIEGKLKDLSVLMHAITTEVYAFAKLEKQRKAHDELRRESKRHASVLAVVHASAMVPATPQEADTVQKVHLAGRGLHHNAARAAAASCKTEFDPPLRLELSKSNAAPSKRLRAYSVSGDSVESQGVNMSLGTSMVSRKPSVLPTGQRQIPIERMLTGAMCSASQEAARGGAEPRVSARTEGRSTARTRRHSGGNVTSPNLVLRPSTFRSCVSEESVDAKLQAHRAFWGVEPPGEVNGGDDSDHSTGSGHAGGSVGDGYGGWATESVDGDDGTVVREPGKVRVDTLRDPGRGTVIGIHGAAVGAPGGACRPARRHSSAAKAWVAPVKGARRGETESDDGSDASAP